MECPECKTKNPDDSKYCKECGTELAPVSVTKILQTPIASPGKAIAGKYKILAELGRGGMGVVYKAEDTTLKRMVALKFLAPELTRDKKARKRFIQEAQAASALDHPNICTIHEIDETVEGQVFIAMGCYEGESLKESIEKDPLKVDDAVDIATQVARGLTKAHSKDIIHRDIKPANIMTTEDGIVKIVDFGLAKLASQTQLTRSGATMGTVAYMSPEQAQGEAVDQRTDIWSLGVVLYEMLTGRLPFSGESIQGMVFSILNKEPEHISSLRSDIPNHIEQVVNKALEKGLTSRYQNIREFQQDLKATPPITFPKAEKSIVVLPFDDMSPGKDNEYFSDGLTEEIISDLSGVRVLRVISRSSAMMLKGRKKRIHEIAKELNVQYVLEGSVRKAGNNLRITAQLIDATNDTHLWAEKYNGTLKNVFDIQEKVSRSIVDALKLKLSPEENKRISERTIEDVKAYECYVKARQEMVRWTEDSLEYAFQLLQNGLEIIGENADLYGGMALAYIYTYEIGIKADEENLRKAEEYAEKAEKLQPNSHHHHYILGRIERFRGSALKAIKHFEKALAIEPNDPEALMFQGYLISTFAGKPDSAEPYVKKLMEIDPLTPANYLSPAFFYLMKGKSDLSIAAFRKWLQLDPGNRWGKWFLSRGLSLYGQLDEAFDVVDQLVKENSKDLAAVLSLFFKYALQGEKDKALQTLTKDAKEFLWHDPEWPEYMVGYFSLINEKEEAFKWLEHSINRGFINYPFLSKNDPFLENICGEARFKKLMKRVKHDWENFEV